MAGAAAVGLGKSCLGDEVREAGLHPENKVLKVSTFRWGVEGDNEAGSYRGLSDSPSCWAISVGGRFEDGDRVEAGKPNSVHTSGDGGLDQSEARSCGRLMTWFQGPQETTRAEACTHSLAHGNGRPGLARPALRPCRIGDRYPPSSSPGSLKGRQRSTVGSGGTSASETHGAVLILLT